MTLKHIVAWATAILLFSGVITGATVWVVHAEDNIQQIPGIVDALREITKQKEMDVEAERKKREYVAAMCQAGKILDRLECAKAGVMLPAAGS